MSRDFDICIAGGIGGLAGMSIMFLLVLPHVQHAEKSMQEEAVKAGKAEYYLDDKHQRQWRWKP